MWLYGKWQEFAKRSTRTPLIGSRFCRGRTAFFGQLRVLMWDDTLLSLARITDRPRSAGRSYLHAIALIAAAGEHAPCGHNWPILRKRGRGCAVATLGFALAEESKLFLTPRGRSSAHAKSTGRDLPTDFAVGRIHDRCSILSDRDTGDGRPGPCHQSPCPEANAAHLHRVRLATRVAGRRF